MRGNLVKITIGDYITNLPGIIRGISYDFPDEGTKVNAPFISFGKTGDPNNNSGGYKNTASPSSTNM